MTERNKSELSGRDRLPASLCAPIARYVAELRGLAADNLIGLAFYGPVAAGEFDPKGGRATNVAVLAEVNLNQLRKLAGSGAAHGQAGIAAPLVMTPEFIKESLDTFPLELLEIQQQHVTVAGQERFTDLPFERANVRLQCERELKVALIGLRQGMLAAAGRESLLGGLGSHAVQTLTRTLRGLLWLKDRTEPRTAREVVTATEELLDRKLPGVRLALDNSAKQGWEQFTALYDDLEALRKRADDW